MKQIRMRLTYANVMSSIAVFLVIGGATAFAALGKNTVGTKQLKKNAVTTAKIKGEAVAAGKIKKDAVVTNRLRDGAVSTEKLAGGAVTSGKLAADERSEVFHAASTSTSPQLANPIAEPPTTVLSVEIPAGGHYVVTAETELINTIGATRFTECSLSDDGADIAQMSDQYEPALIFPSGGVSMTGISDGGILKLACKSNGNNTFAFEAQIIATRVGSVTG